jgi:lambda family phage tail tape measure protein
MNSIAKTKDYDMASNIRVVLEIDNKKYLTDLKAADNATQSFAKSATSSSQTVNSSFGNIGISANSLISRLGGLRTALLGIVSATAIQQANNFANSIKDISTTTDISIDSILNMGKAFDVNGGSAEGAQKSLLKFAESVANARSGNDAALKSFKDIGITIDDLNKTGIEELTKKSIAGIAGLSSAASQIRTQTELFGKTAKGVSFGGVQEQTTKNYISPETVSAIQSGADASENMKKQFANLTEALLKVAQPLNDIVKSINISVSAFESLIKSVVAAVAVWFIFAKAITAVNTFFGAFGTALATAGGAMSFLMKQLWGVVAGFKAFFVNLGRVVGIFATAYGGVASFGFALAGVLRALLRFAGVVGIVYSVAEGIDFLSKLIFNFSPVDFLIEKFNKLIAVSKELLGIKPPDDKIGGGRGGNAETLKLQQEQGEKQKKLWDEQQQAIADYKERVSKLAVEIRKVGDSYAYNNDFQLQSLALEARLVGKTEDEIERAKGLAEIYKHQEDTIKQLNETRKQWAKGTEEQKANLGLIDAEIAKIKQLTNAQAADYNDYLDILQGKRMVEKARLQDIENLTKAMEQQSRIQEQLAGARLTMIGQKQDVEFNVSKIGKSDFQKQMMDIAETNRKAGLEASRAFAQAFEDGGDGLTPERVKQLADGLDAIRQGYDEISKAQIDSFMASQTFDAGWQEAFANYKQSSQDSAQTAKQAFETFTGGLEDAFVKFVQTGKLSFKDLINSMIADFAKLQAKKAIGGLMDMGGGSGIGSLFGGIGKLLGFADGGNPPMGKASIVGERGAELLIPRNASTVVPLEGLGGGGGTSVTYNINATDAASFKQMLAREPEFLFAITESGRRNMPTRSRR